MMNNAFLNGKRIAANAYPDRIENTTLTTTTVVATIALEINAGPNTPRVQAVEKFSNEIDFGIVKPLTRVPGSFNASITIDTSG